LRLIVGLRVTISPTWNLCEVIGNAVILIVSFTAVAVVSWRVAAGGRGDAMHGERLEVSVTFDPAKGYIASSPELRTPVAALSLSGLRKRIEALMVPPDGIDIKLVLDRKARFERDHRRRQVVQAR
jgi:hypothetical protein